jgi:hypothetical protein
VFGLVPTKVAHPVRDGTGGVARPKEYAAVQVFHEVLERPVLIEFHISAVKRGLVSKHDQLTIYPDLGVRFPLRRYNLAPAGSFQEPGSAL